MRALTEQDDLKPLSGRASIKVESKEALEDGRFLYKCTLSDIVPDIDTGSIQMSDRKHVDRVLIEDRLQFADYIMIDTRGGDEFNCDYVFSNAKDEMSFIAGEMFSAVATDVFGKEYLADIDF